VLSKHEPVDHKSSAMPGEPDVDSNKILKDEYAVGYARPPTGTRFKPGKSGNRHGKGHSCTGH